MSARLLIVGLVALYASVCAHFSPVLSQILPLETYTEDDVRKFVLPGTTREAVIQRFGQPVYNQKNPKFEDGSQRADEILYFDLRPSNPPREERWVFAGFQVWLKDGKTVKWMATHRDVHVGR